MRMLSRLFHQTVGKVICYLSGIRFSGLLKGFKDGLYVVSPEPPYVSQLGGARKDSTQGDGEVIDDKKAMSLFGAKNIESFSYWAWRACGIVGVRMILKAVLGKKFDKSTMELVEEGLQLRGYDIKNDVGWYHQALLELGRKYGVDGKMAKFVSSAEIAYIVLSGSYVLASIFSSSGGHLLLIYGVKIKKGKLVSFLTHDPYDLNENGKAKQVTKKVFDKLSTRRIIIFENKNGSCVRLES